MHQSNHEERQHMFNVVRVNIQSLDHCWTISCLESDTCDLVHEDRRIASNAFYYQKIQYNILEVWTGTLYESNYWIALLVFDLARSLQFFINYNSIDAIVPVTKLAQNDGFFFLWAGGPPPPSHTRLKTVPASHVSSHNWGSELKTRYL